MSLGTWFRDYVYIPLGGNRVSKIKWFRNIFVVWVLTGLWHGAAWNFIIWGLYFAVLLVMEKMFVGKILEKVPSFLSRIYMIFLILISFIIFSGENLQNIIENIKGLFGIGNVPLISLESIYYFKSYFVLLVIALVGSTPIMKNIVCKEKIHNFINILEPVFLMFILIISTSYIVDGSFNPFLYFRF